MASASPFNITALAATTDAANTTANLSMPVKRQSLRDVELRFHCDHESAGETSCPYRNVTIDLDKRYKHDCANHALVAMAAQREFCGSPDARVVSGGWCIGFGDSEDGANHTWIDIPRCCSRWVQVDDPFTSHYPYVINPDTGYEYPTFTTIWLQAQNQDYWAHWNYDFDFADHFYGNRHPDVIWRNAMMQEAWEFRATGLFGKCGQFFPQGEDEYQYYMANLVKYGLDPEAEKKKAIKDYETPTEAPDCRSG